VSAFLYAYYFKLYFIYLFVNLTFVLCIFVFPERMDEIHRQHPLGVQRHAFGPLARNRPNRGEFRPESHAPIFRGEVPSKTGHRHSRKGEKYFGAGGAIQGRGEQFF
jgi:hypothetical protein